MEVTVKIHSLTHTITNSSETVYSYVTSDGTNIVKNIINKVLKDAGSDQTVDDLYEVDVVVEDEQTYDYMLYDLPEEELATCPTGWSERIEWAKNYAEEHSIDLSRYRGEYYDSSIRVRAKEGSEEAEKLFGKLNSLFNTEAVFG